MSQLWIATTNKGKLSEFRLLAEKLAPQITICGIDDLPVYSQPPETGKTFLENAQIKARSLRAMKPTDYVMAEDSGLEVEGLNQLPGVHSARYAGEKARDIENNAKILKMLQIRSPLNRTARFFCQIVLFTPASEKKELHFDGELRGEIAKDLRGTSGFGYDPLFVPSGESKTLAELGLAYKNLNSHRSIAFRKVLENFESGSQV